MIVAERRVRQRPRPVLLGQPLARAVDVDVPHAAGEQLRHHGRLVDVLDRVDARLALRLRGADEPAARPLADRVAGHARQLAHLAGQEAPVRSHRDVKVCQASADKCPMTVLYVVVGLAVLIGLWVVVTNNSFIKSRNKVDEAWSGIDVQLKRRHDLVPNLVETVKGYAAHESATLADRHPGPLRRHVGRLRRRARRRRGAARLARCGGVRVVAEQYPELRAAQNYQQLMAELSELEDQIQAARRIFNANVNAYNTRIQLFPNSIVAGSKFTPRELFQLDSPAERAVPVVAF